ncbi:MAG: hypothetical protein FD144_2720 [Rhodospirillaceae bacterium]|nr:MAG: hypothetical protein FD144_2720 [Rhodospirillaceae bacterium]
MSDGAQFTHAHMVRFERRLPGTPAQAWGFLTDPGRLPGWYGDSRIEPRIGGAVSLMGGHIRGVVTQWQPPGRLAYTWNVYNPGDATSPYPESYVILTLAASVEGTLLTLEHLPVLESFVKLNAMGWHTFIDMVEAAVRGEAVHGRDHYMARNATHYGVDLANPLG